MWLLLFDSGISFRFCNFLLLLLFLLPFVGRDLAMSSKLGWADKLEHITSKLWPGHLTDLDCEHTHTHTHKPSMSISSDLFLSCPVQFFVQVGQSPQLQPQQQVPQAQQAPQASPAQPPGHPQVQIQQPQQPPLPYQPMQATSVVSLHNWLALTHTCYPALAYRPHLLDVVCPGNPM